MSNISPIGICSFPNLFTAKSPTPGAEPRFSVNVIWTKEQQAEEAYQLLRQSIVGAAVEKFGNKAVDMLKNGQLRSPLRNANEKDYNGYDVPGAMYANFWSKQAPSVIDGKLQDVIDAGYAYPGSLIRVSYRPFAYDASGNRGVSLGLLNVQVTDVTTPRLDGRKAAKDEFGATSSAPEQELEDDLPF